MYFKPSRIYQNFTLTIKDILINAQDNPYSLILKETLNIIQGTLIINHQNVLYGIKCVPLMWTNVILYNEDHD